MDIKEVNWERLKHPSKNLRMFEPTPERLVDLSEKLLAEPMFLPDEHRDRKWIELIVAAMFSGIQLNVIYEIGDWKGIVAFQDIWPGYRAETSFLLWDKAFIPGSQNDPVGLRGKWCWGADFIRELQELVNLIMDEFKLKRLGISTPDEYTVRIATRFLGFKIEGNQKYGFRHDGKLFTQHLLRRVDR